MFSKVLVQEVAVSLLVTQQLGVMVCLQPALSMARDSPRGTSSKDEKPDGYSRMICTEALYLCRSTTILQAHASEISAPV